MASEPGPLFIYRQLGRALLLRMQRTAETIAEVDSFAVMVDAAHRAAGQPLFLVHLPHSGLTRPSDEIRSVIYKRVKERFARGHIELAFLVIPMGNPFTRALLRSFFSGARLLLGLRHRVKIVDELADAAREIEARCGIKASDVIKAAQELSAPP